MNWHDYLTCRRCAPGKPCHEQRRDDAILAEQEAAADAADAARNAAWTPGTEAWARRVAARPAGSWAVQTGWDDLGQRTYAPEDDPARDWR